MITLAIDTTDLEKVTFQLRDAKTKKVTAQSITQVSHHESDKILTHLDKFLKHQKSPKLSSIQVSAREGGSYTGIRIGTAIGQALSLAWNIPLKVKK